MQIDLAPTSYGYSMKNIPVTTKRKFLTALIEKIESLIRRMRWKAHFFENPGNKVNKETYGFKSEYAPPKNERITPFEDDLYALINDIQFRKVTDDFQNMINRDAGDIKKLDKLLVPADKSSNLYSLSREQYDKLLRENVTKTYKKADGGTMKRINKEAKEIAEELKIEGKVHCMAEREAFITLKDHKENFKANPKCRLINPAKSEIGKISKQILQGINAAVTKALALNQWRNTQDVLKWFEAIGNKNSAKFLKFDVVDFYPSITEKLLDDSISFAKSVCNISGDEIRIIKHACKSVLFYDGETWIKKDNTGTFDITMGSYHGAEVCELVGLLLLSELEIIVGKKNVGLYRDDGLAVIENASGPEMEQINKKIRELFKKHNLDITTDTNLPATDFLDVTLDNRNAKFYPYRKPNNQPVYVHKKSNHPPNILKQIPTMIERRIADLSCNQQEFDKAKPAYENALKHSGYAHSMKYTHNGQGEQPKRKNRKRNIIWFNPPYCKSVKNNIGKKFLELIGKHFPTHHRYRKLFNKNNMKISYSCMENMGHIISRHNKYVMKDEPITNAPECNCRRSNKDSCPMNGNCQAKAIIYKATVTGDGKEMDYYGLCEKAFKTRYGNHKQALNNREYQQTKLSEYVWKLKDKKKVYEIKWKIEQRSNAYLNGSRKCNLCLSEKLVIALAEKNRTLNERSELISKCRHSNKFLLKKYK